MTAQQYKPGDVANGYVLTEDGRWVPIAPAVAPVFRPTPISSRQWALIIGGPIAFIMLLATVGVLSGGGSSSASGGGDVDPDVVASIAWNRLDQPTRDTLCEIYDTSPSLSESMMEDQGIPSDQIDAMMPLLAREC